MEKRDLKADLELCNKATPGPWIKDERVGCVAVYPESAGEINCMEESAGKRIFYKGGVRVDDERGIFKHWTVKEQDIHDAEFIAQAREGWPHAIERAIEAEELSRELLKALKFFFKCLSDKDLVEPEPSHFLSLELSQIATLCQKAEEVLGDES